MPNNCCNVERDDAEEPKAPQTFFPSTLFVILTMGVLSDECDPLLNHVIDRGEVDESSKVTVPTRSECRTSALADAPSPSVSTVISSPTSSIQRLRDRVSYNEAYKKANQQKKRAWYQATEAV